MAVDTLSANGVVGGQERIDNGRGLFDGDSNEYILLLSLSRRKETATY
jgi:hypothetical protein